MGLDLKQLILIFLIVLLLFGGKKLPALARSIGQGISEFKKGISGSGDTTTETSEVYQPPTASESSQEEEIVEKDVTPPRKALPAGKKAVKTSSTAKKTAVKTAGKTTAKKTAAKKTSSRSKKA